MSVLPISIQNRISEMKENFTSKGFYISKDQELLLVDRIRESNEHMTIFEAHRDYDVVFLCPESEDEFSEEVITFPEEDVYVEKGDEIISIGYDSDEEAVVVSEGAILDVDDSGSETVFTVQTDAAFKPKIYSVFSLDKVNSCLNLVGIFSPKLGKVVHIQFFEEETRGGNALVFCGSFHGKEDKNPGKGPRGLIINESKLPKELNYSLKFEHQNGFLHPYKDRKYHKNEKLLYQTALNQFVELYQANGTIPQEFSFDCYRTSSYKATLLE
jgi:hypothetical protein